MISSSTWGLTNLVTAAFFTLIVYISSWIVYTRTLHRFADVSGPFWASVSRGWLVAQVVRGDLEKTTRELHKKHGPLVRIAPDEISIAAPSAIKQLYGTGRPVYKKTDFYLPMRSGISAFPDPLTITDPAQHAERKRIVSALYTTSAALEAEPYITACVKTLVSQLSAAAYANVPLDLSDWMQFYTFDAIGELYFGAPFKFLATGSDHNGWIHALDTVFPIFTASCAASDFLRRLFPIVALGSTRVRAAFGAFNKMVEVAEDCVRARQRKIDCGEDIGRIDMLAKLFDIREAHAKTKVGGAIDSFPFASIVQESFVGIFAGSDTTAIALRSIIYHLMKRPDSYQKLHSEIVAAVEAGDLLRDADAGYIRYADAIKLPYLLACCKEGMRLHPSVSMSMPRHVPVGGAEIAGRWFQGGDKVGVNAAVVHYDTTIFGDDVDVFRPERWFDGIKDAKLMDSHMLHFSAGPRTCLGKNIALVEIYKLIPQLVWEFDMELAHPDKEWVTNNVFLNKQTGIWVKVRKRERVAAFLDV